MKRHASAGLLGLVAWLALSCVTRVAPPTGGDSDASVRTQPSGTPEAGEPTGVLTGLVTRGPVSPIVVAGDSTPPQPTRGVRVVVAGLDGSLVATALTGGQGTFRFTLQPGDYRVTLGEVLGGGFSKDVPAEVRVNAGSETRLDIRVDTGIR